MKVFRKFTRLIFTIYAFTIFIALMLLLFPFVILASFFGKVRGGNMIYRICLLWTDISMFAWGISHRNIYETPYLKDHPVIFVFNHISYIDIPLLFKAFRKRPVRILGKAELAKAPVFGYIYRNAVVMVDRDSEEARLRSVRLLKRVLTKDISIVIAPEGTFNTTGMPLKEFYNGAFKIAVETNTPIQPVILPDAYDRFNYHSILSLTPGRSRAVFLPEVLPGKDAALLKQHVFDEMEAALIKYKASWITNN